MSNFGSDTSKFKLVIYLKNGNRQVFYSLENEEKHSDQKAVNGMVRRLLRGKFNGKYQTALVYDRLSDTVIRKFINGIEELQN